MKSSITIATRGSALALIQANGVKAALEAKHDDLTVTLEIIKTTGDKIQDVPLAKVGGKGLFVKEIEEAIMDGRADIAVHSMKDVPTDLPDSLYIAAMPKREDFRDAFVSTSVDGLAGLPEGATVGTSSLRRQSQLLIKRPDLNIVSIRGNVDTRLRKLESENLDAIMLAAAGLIRMDLAGRITEFLDPEVMLPAIGQGAIGIEARKNDQAVLDRIAFLDHEPTSVCVAAERAFLERLDGGCQVPFAALAGLNGDTLTLEGMVADPDGQRHFRDSIIADKKSGVKLGIDLAEKLLGLGADQVLAELNI